MRIIKFRGKVKYNGNHKFSGDWIYGYYRSNENGNAFITETLDEMDNYIFDETEIDENTVGQFTGLHDKNGKEIYEGDIVKATYEFENNETSSEIGVVKNKIHKFILENRQKYEFEIEYFDYLEVIGNVWDNPELLERS